MNIELSILVEDGNDIILHTIPPGNDFEAYIKNLLIYYPEKNLPKFVKWCKENIDYSIEVEKYSISQLLSIIKSMGRIEEVYDVLTCATRAEYAQWITDLIEIYNKGEIK